MRRFFCRIVPVLLVCNVGAVARPALGAEAPTPGPAPVSVDVAPVDVLGNVRRMLEEGRQSHPETGQASGPGEAAPAVVPTPGDAASHDGAGGAGSASQEGVAAPAAVTPHGMPAAGAAAPSASSAPPSPPPPSAPPPARDDGHVPVPNKEITIRDLKDIRGLATELEQARKRKQSGQ